jgi:hydrogenase maturation factor
MTTPPPDLPLPEPEGATTACGEDVCITCSDVAVAVRIHAVLPDGLAVVETEAGPEEISIALVDAGPGDVVLVHAKEALCLMERAE